MGNIVATWNFAGGATAPAQFGSGDWSVADKGTGGTATITISTLPSDGGSAITSLQYQLNGGGWSPLGGTATGAYDVAAANGTHDVAVRAVNAIGAGPASATKQVTTTGSAGGTFATVDALRTDNTTRGVPVGTSLKQIGVDSLPSGVSYGSNSVTVNSDGVTLDGWSFAGRKVNVRGFNTIFDNCLFANDGTAGLANEVIQIWDDGSVARFRNCTFLGPGYYGNVEVPALNCLKARKNGSGASVAVGAFDLIEFCDFFGWAADVIKSASGGTIRRNYFDTPTNLPAGAAVYSAGTSYDTGDWVTDVAYTYAYFSKTDGNQGNALPSGKSSNTHWQNVDPHADTINPYIATGPLLIEENFINRSQTARAVDPGSLRAVGVNNGIRNNRNNNHNDEPHDVVTSRFNIITASAPFRNVSYPVSGNSYTGEVNTAADVYEDNWLGTNDGGEAFAPGTSTGNTIQNNDLTYVSPGTAAAGPAVTS